MKTFAFFLILMITSLPSHTQAQNAAQWGKLVKGKYAVGYKDTVIFKDDELFSFHSYKGKKPFFISIWYPATGKSTASQMKYGDYLDLPENKKVTMLRDSLISRYKWVLETTGVTININPDAEGEVKMDPLHTSLLSDILATKVMATRNLPAIKEKVPCIVYHHGAQSTHFENNVFGEYMASNGFMVISASYNLPGEADPRQLIPGSPGYDFVDDYDYVAKWAQKLPNVDTANMYAAGHSWGGQTALLQDEKPGPKLFKRIYAYHTTLEDKNMDAARKGWPYFKNTFDNNCGNCTTPSLIFAPVNLASVIDTDTVTGKETLLRVDTLYPAFTPFRNNKTTQYSFITLRHRLKHDGFISMGNVRSPFTKKYKLADGNEVRTQQHYYEQILKATVFAITMDVIHFPLPVDKSLEMDFKSEQYPE